MAKYLSTFFNQTIYYLAREKASSVVLVWLYIDRRCTVAHGKLATHSLVVQILEKP